MFYKKMEDFYFEIIQVRVCVLLLLLVVVNDYLVVVGDYFIVWVVVFFDYNIEYFFFVCVVREYNLVFVGV